MRHGVHGQIPGKTEQRESLVLGAARHRKAAESTGPHLHARLAPVAGNGERHQLAAALVDVMLRFIHRQPRRFQHHIQVERRADSPAQKIVRLRLHDQRGLPCLERWRLLLARRKTNRVSRFVQPHEKQPVRRIVQLENRIPCAALFQHRAKPAESIRSSDFDFHGRAGADDLYYRVHGDRRRGGQRRQHHGRGD